MREMLIMVDATNNNNKFYEIELIGDMVHAWSGRVGDTRVAQKPKSGGESEYKKRRSAKIKKGYLPSKVNLEVIEESTGTKGNMLDIAMEQITTDDISAILVAELVKQNIHNITSNTKIKYDIKTGYFKTALGIITKEGVETAIELLEKIENLVVNDKLNKDSVGIKYKKFISYNEQYFSIIPTKIRNLRIFENLINDSKKIEAQMDICTALLNSLDIIEDEKHKAKTKANGKKIVHEKVFEASILHLKDKTEYKRIEKYFNDSKNSRHGYNTNSYKLKNIFKINLGQEEKEFRSDMDNIQELFHGTKIANLLSILKSGLLMPKQSPGQTTGYMFGQGLYFASQSTKSLNYCDGMYWNNSKSSGKIYMFIADIAMGNYQVPRGSRSKNPDKGYDSYWAQPGKSGIQNDEMIIFKNNQIKLKYILEISK